jgi:hypothetical protein
VKKKILAGILAGVIGFSGVAFAENEATYDSSTGIVSIPKVIVGTAVYQVDMQQTEGLNFSVTTVTPTSLSSNNISIVGSWGNGYYAQGTENEGEPEYMSLTFYPNGYYIHYESDQQAEPDDNGGGVEYGTYTYNATTGVLAASSIVDENGGIGLTEHGAPASLVISITNDQLTVLDCGMTLNRVQ